ncbi:hypothetical protein B5M09_003412 [Aphanomyces astaci]|uniref:Ubiquitin-like domain-containing protein n=1 Tax=Aphanomyces astaci TaxID=112090 RepID=A0A425DI15_APHAT|nr:hypothetical protein B5M09_003412 [Aphanomyces astaci]
MDTISSVFDVKTHLEMLSGVAARSQRLLFKGKYPTDDLVLSSLVSSTNTSPSSLVFMLLFDERQHVRVDVQATTVELQLQLVTHRTNLARLEGQIQRNFFDATDVSLRLRQLLDAVEILLSNAEIACDSSPSHDLRQLSTDAQTLRDAITLVHEALITRRT